MTKQDTDRVAKGLLDCLRKMKDNNGFLHRWRNLDPEFRDYFRDMAKAAIKAYKKGKK